MKNKQVKKRKRERSQEWSSTPIRNRRKVPACNVNTTRAIVIRRGDTEKRIEVYGE